MRTLRASELGSFLYCQRAWWYQRQGLPSHNQTEMQLGTDFHRSHARGVKLTHVYEWIAILLASVAVLLLLLSLIQ